MLQYLKVTFGVISGRVIKDLLLLLLLLLFAYIETAFELITKIIMLYGCQTVVVL